MPDNDRSCSRACTYVYKAYTCEVGFSFRIVVETERPLLKEVFTATMSALTRFAPFLRPYKEIPFCPLTIKTRGCRSKTEEKQDDVENITRQLEEAALGTNPSTEQDENWMTSPYPKGAHVGRSQALRRDPAIDPRETSIILFPGQGTQYVGMGRELLRFPSARDVFEAANEILGYDILQLCLKGPKHELDRTIHCQPAIFTCSLAAVERLHEERPKAVESCIATAGFSLGEITALTFAGALRFDRALKLVKIRAEAMQLAADAEDSGMMTVLYGPDSELTKAMSSAKEWCKEQGIENPECCVATYLFPHCKVVAGHSEALRYIEDNKRQFRLKACKRLQVSGAFHSSLMRPAAEKFREAIRHTTVDDPAITVVSNVNGKRYANGNHVKRQLPKQIYQPVHWEQSLHALYERPVGDSFPRTFECGPGDSLRQVLKKVNGKAWNTSWTVTI